MKRMFLSLLAVALFALTSHAQQANIYASGLSAGTPANGEVEISYTLNADATALAVNFVNSGQQVAASVNVTEAALLTKGAHTATISLATVPAGTYTYSVTAAAAANTAPVKISGVDSKFRFYLPTGLAVDNSFESPAFGRIYVAEGAGSFLEGEGAATYWPDGRISHDGIYIFTSDLNAVNTEAYTGNVAWDTGGLTFSGQGTSPGRLSIDDAGKVYIADNSLANSGVYVMDPAHPENDFSAVFAAGDRDATGIVSIGETQIHGRIPALYVEGSGENTNLYYIDRNYLPAGQEARAYLPSGMIFKYTPLTAPVSSQPALVYDNANSYLANDAMGLVSDGRGGFWVCQNRGTDGLGSLPSLTHINAAGLVDYRSADGENINLGNSARGALAINAEKNLLAVASNRTVKIVSVAYDESTGVPTLTEVSYSAQVGTIGTNVDGLAFDVAGNLYITSASPEFLYVYALPKAENTFTTPAPAASTITVENATPPATVALTTLFTKADYSWNTGNVSRDAAVYDGKVYAIDNSGKIHVIDGATGEEDVAALITNENLKCFGITSDGAGKLYVPSNNTGGASAFGISTVDLLNANTVTTLTYAGEGTVGDNKRTDYIEAYRVDATTTYIAGPSTNTTPHLRIWSTDGATVSTPVIATDVNAGNNNTGGDVTWIDATHLITTGQNNIPQYVTIDPTAGTATHEPIGEATTAFGGSAYFVLSGTPYLVLTDGGLGAVKVYDITDKTAPAEVASAPAIGSVANGSVHVGIDAFVSGNVATIYVWSPNNGLAVHNLTVGGGTDIPAVAANPAVTITVKSYELEVKTGGAQLAGYALYGIDGRLVRSGKANGTSASIATGHLPQGVYVLQVTTSEGAVAKKFMKR